jgi:aromatic-L-amino-acid/L-tryptophan decarboxylase
MREPNHSCGLDVSLEKFKSDLEKTLEVVLRLFESLPESRITTAKTRPELASLFDEPLPDQPQIIETILHQVETGIFANSTLYSSPRFFGYINSSGNQASILAELLAASLNQICTLWHFSPAASEVEQRVIRWIAEFIGYEPSAGGCLLSGGSAANLVALAAARRQRAPYDVAMNGMNDRQPLTIYMSQEGHASVDKAMSLLGMGRKHLRRISVNDDFRVNIPALERAIDEDRKSGCIPICVVGVAGSTNTGAIDPLEHLATVCQANGLWLHVDAAYGGPAAGTGSVGALFRGLEQADSVTVNPHKWLYVPAEIGCILVRDQIALKQAFEVTADYLREGDTNAQARLDFKDYGPQLTRSFRALKMWMTFKAYGAKQLRASIESNIEIMQYLARRIDESEDFALMAPAPLSVVCFQYRTLDPKRQRDSEYLNDLNGRLADALERDGRVFVSATSLRGKRVLRACSVNHRLTREDVECLLSVSREIGRVLEVSGPSTARK